MPETQTLQARNRFRGTLRLVAIAIAALLAWAALVVVGTYGGWWRATLAPRGDAKAFVAATSRLIDERYKGNVAFALLDKGRVLGTHFRSRGRSIGGDTLFQMGSVSKWMTAWGVMKLVEDGKVELDAPVSRYLKRWHLPRSDFDNNGVTIRRLLSHTAGLTDGLGFRGFPPGARVQTLEQALTHAADAMPGADGRTHVGAEPGSTFQYSGGGYALLQLLIEEVSSEPFDTFMRRAILRPLGMTRSTFVLEDGAPDAAEFFADGAPAPHYRFAAASTSSLYTSLNEMTRFVQAQTPGPNGEPAGRDVLRPETIAEMERPTGFRLGFPVYGLGLLIYAENDAGGNIVGHDGGNYPAVNTAVRFDPATGDGIIILQTGSPKLASEIANDWTFWRSGNVGIIAFMMELEQTLIVFAIGAVAIIVVAVVVGWRLTSR